MRAFETEITIEKIRLTNGYRWVIFKDKFGYNRIGFPYGEFDDDCVGKKYRVFIVTHTEEGKQTNIVYFLNRINNNKESEEN
jgi:hypothetical protein